MSKCREADDRRHSIGSRLNFARLGFPATLVLVIGWVMSLATQAEISAAPKSAEADSKWAPRIQEFASRDNHAPFVPAASGDPVLWPSSGFPLPRERTVFAANAEHNRLKKLATSVRLSGAKTAATTTKRLGIGREARPEEIAGWDIDIRPDGQGLPPGKGTVRQGEAIYMFHLSRLNSPATSRMALSALISFDVAVTFVRDISVNVSQQV